MVPSTNRNGTIQATNHRRRCSPNSPLAYVCVCLAACLFYIFYTGYYLGNDFPKSNEGLLVEEEEPIHQVFHSPKLFMHNYEDMEMNFKVYMYPDYKDPYYPCGDISQVTVDYMSESYFFEKIRDSQFLTLDPDEAQLFFIPLSCQETGEMGVQKVSFNVQDIIFKYPYWNRSLGADHFFVTCNDIEASPFTEQVQFLAKNSIRVQCSASYNDYEYNAHKDVSLPEIISAVGDLADAGTEFNNRTKLGFWVGRPIAGVIPGTFILPKDEVDFDFWTSFNDRSTVQLKYTIKFSSAKFCICPRAVHVDGTCVAESILVGCVPVVLSDYYDLPFNDILDWKEFSVVIKEDDVFRLKEILKAISFSEYKDLQANLMKVQRHFHWNSPPTKYDAFHMVMYELWLRHHVIRY